MATKTFISSGSPFEEQIGYSRAVVSGDLIFVSGCTGYNYRTQTLPPDITAQTKQCTLNITAALHSAGATPADILRIRYILPDRADFPATWPILREWLGSNRPAATMIQAGLMEEDMRIEIEVTARKPRGGGEIVETVLL